MLRHKLGSICWYVECEKQLCNYDLVGEKMLDVKQNYSKIYTKNSFDL